MKGRQDPSPWRDPRREAEAEVDDELAFHLEALVEARVARGEDPGEARAAVLREEGFARARQTLVAQARRGRTRRGWRDALEGTWRDLGLACRRLWRTPAFALAAVLTLALGVGANTAVFTVLDAVALRPLPYPDPGRLVAVWPGKVLNSALVREVEERTPSLRGVAGNARWQFTLLEGDDPRLLDAEMVHPAWLETLGARPHLGRLFADEEHQEGADAVVILSHGLWVERFGADSTVVGRVLALDGYDHEARRVVGVMSPTFAGPEGPAHVWAPLRWSATMAVSDDPSWHLNGVVARLAPGADPLRASAELAAVARGLHREFPVAVPEDHLPMARVAPLGEVVAGELGTTLWLLLGTVGLVLLIASANLANLLLARGEARAREAAVRVALGAGRGRLLRQSLAEAAVLAGAGCLAGVAAGWVVLALLRGELAGALPALSTVQTNPRVLLFALVTTGTAVLLAAGLPALRAASADPRLRLGSGTSGGGRDRSSHRLNRLLVTSQLALATAVVVAAGLVGKSFRSLLLTDPGFQSRGVFTAELSLPMNRYPGGAQRDVVDRLVRRVQALPGVESAGGIHLLPLTASNWNFPILPEGHVPRADEPLPSANYRVVAGDYFGTLGIPLLAGELPAREGAGPPERLMVVNQAFGERFFPGQDPVGRVVQLFGNQPFQVAAVVGDVRQHALTARALPEMYVYFGSSSPGRIQLMVRGTLDRDGMAVALREAVRSEDAALPLVGFRSLDEVRGASLARERLVTLLLGGFGGLALLLGALGVYGVTSYTVRARLRELGIRTAIGGSPGSVLAGALARALGPVVLGLALGAAAALAVGQLLGGLLYQVEPRDPTVLLTTLTALAAAATVAAWLPVHRAARRLDPVAVLRAE